MKRTKLVLILVICVALAAIGVSFFLSRPTGNMMMEAITVKASDEGPHGISPDSSFKIRSKYWAGKDQIQKLLDIQPGIGEYELSGFGWWFTLKPVEPLQRNTVYTIQILGENGEVVRSFAFQSESDLQVSSTYPSIGEYYVSPETGIEITFNSPVEQIEDYFTILPQTPGTFEAKDYTVIFRPNAPLEEDYIYQVTLGAGLTASNGMQLQEDYVFSFQTASEKEDFRRLSLQNDFFGTFVPGDDITMSMWTWDDLKGQKFDITVHQYQDIHEYMDDVKRYQQFYYERYGKRTDFHINLQGLKEVSFHNEELIAGQSGNNYAALFPNDLSEGFYVATVAGAAADNQEQYVQMMFQVSNFSLYTQSSNGEVYCWVNDISTGKPASEVEILLQDAQNDAAFVSAMSGEDGVARLESADMEDAYLTLLVDNQPVFFDYLGLNALENGPLPLPEQYYTAVYTDREIYQPNDLIALWGIIRPRQTQEMPKNVTIALSRDWYSKENPSLYRMKVQPDAATGIFEGELAVNNLAAGMYMVSVLDDSGQVYMQKYLQVKQYQKPEYTITVTADKDYYFADETIRLTVDAKFYDGTPFAGGKLGFDSGWLSQNGAAQQQFIELDEAGHATYEVRYTKPEWETENGWTPFTAHYIIYGAEEENSYNGYSGNVVIFPSKTAAKAEFTADDTLEIETAVLDSSKWESAGTDVLPKIYPPEIDLFEQYKGAALNEEITVRIYRSELIKTPTGESYYDYINKVEVQQYTYHEEKTLVKTVSVKTGNGKATINEIPTDDRSDLVGYYAEVDVPNGMDGVITVYGYTNRPIMPYGLYGADTDRFSFASEWQTFADIGQEVTLGLYKNEKPINNQGAVFYTIGQRGVTSTAIYESNTESITMDESYLPNVVVAGAYFDGRHIYPVLPYRIAYAYDSKALDIVLETDRESYEPGSQATITAKVTDQQGSPVQASLVIGVVDEAVFALAEQDFTLADLLYASVDYPGIRQKASYQQLSNLLMKDAEAANAATGGGGEEGAADRAMDGDVRKTFVDTADFQTLQTNEDGTAQLSLTLPDNITSWRITAGAVTDDLRAGSNTANSIVSKPFYLRTLITPSYLAADDVVVAVSAVGSHVAPGDEVEYTVRLLNEQGKELGQETVTAKAGVRSFVNFGKQPEGVYRVAVQGSLGNFRDAVEQPVSVIKQGLTVPVFKTVSLEEAGNISSLRYPVKITVYDERSRPFMQGIGLLSEKSSDRTEIMVAAYRARQIANDLLEESDRAVIYKDARLDMIQDGGIKALPAAEPDAATTAKLLIAAPELVPYPDQAVFYLQGVLSDSAETAHQKVMAQAGLAAAGQPVLLDVRHMLENDDSLTVSERLYLGAGLAKMGDYIGAEKVYQSLKKEVVSDTGVKYVKGADLEAQLENTAAALMLTAIIQHEDADLLMDYFLKMDKDRAKSATVSYELEVLAYLESFTVLAGLESGQFGYTQGGEYQEITLGKKAYQTLSLGHDDLQNAGFKVLKGDLYAAIQYTDYAATQKENPSPVATIQKTFTPVDKGDMETAKRIRVDLTITMDPDAPSGSYRIFDYIPSGMRHLSDLPNYSGIMGSSLYNSEAQSMYGYLYWSREDYKNASAPAAALEQATPDMEADIPVPVAEGVEPAAVNPPMDEPDWEMDQEGPSNVFTFTYYVNTALEGEFTSEGAYIVMDLDSSYYAQGEEETVIITQK